MQVQYTQRCIFWLQLCMHVRSQTGHKSKFTLKYKTEYHSNVGPWIERHSYSSYPPLINSALSSWVCLTPALCLLGWGHTFTILNCGGWRRLKLVHCVVNYDSLPTIAKQNVVYRGVAALCRQGSSVVCLHLYNFHPPKTVIVFCSNCHSSGDILDHRNRIIIVSGFIVVQ